MEESIDVLYLGPYGQPKPEPPKPPPRRPILWKALGLGSAFVLTLGLLVGLIWWKHQPEPPPAPLPSKGYRLPTKSKDIGAVMKILPEHLQPDTPE